jgi:hypothetical protein
LVWLAALEGRARGRLRDQRGTDDALVRTEQAREQVQGDDDPGGLFEFSPGVQHYYASTARLWLDDSSNHAEAERLATTALDLLESGPPETRHLGYIATVRLDLALAHFGRDDLDGAATNVGDVLILTAQRRSEPVARRLRHVANALDRPRFQTTSLALNLRDQIRTAISR